MNTNWRRERTPSGVMDYIIDGDNITVCEMIVRYGDADYEPRMALIMAAPELASQRDAMQRRAEAAEADYLACETAATEMRKAIERTLQDLADDEEHDARFAVICDMLRDSLEGVPVFVKRNCAHCGDELDATDKYKSASGEDLCWLCDADAREVAA